MIRPMQASDLQTVYELEVRGFSDPWPFSSFEYELNENPFSKAFVLEENGKTIGYAIVWIMFEQAQLVSITVDPDARKKGHGQALMEQVLKTAKEEGSEWISLEVRVSNKAARHLYEKNGFSAIHTTRHYYSDGEDALVMGKGI